MAEIGTGPKRVLGDLLTAPARGFGDGFTSLRTGLACMLAWLLATSLSGNATPFFAPVLALLTLQASIYSTIALGLQRTIGNGLGVLLATGFVNVVGLSWWSLALAAGLSVGIARLLPLGYSGQIQIPLAVLLVVMLGPVKPEIGLWRAVDCALGGLAGIAIAVAWPTSPSYATAVRAQRRWLASLATQIETIAVGLDQPRQQLLRGVRHGFIQGSRALFGISAEGRAALDHAEESVRFNPRGRAVRDRIAGLDAREAWLGRLTLQVRMLSYAVDRLYDRAVDPALPRDRLAQLLRRLAGSVARAPVAETDDESMRLQGEIADTVREVTGDDIGALAALDSVSILGRIEQLRQDLADPDDELP